MSEKPEEQTKRLTPDITIRNIRWSDAILYLLVSAIEENQVISDERFRAAIAYFLTEIKGVLRYRTRGLRDVTVSEVFEMVFKRWFDDGLFFVCVEVVDVGTTVRYLIAAQQKERFCSKVKQHLDPLVAGVKGCFTDDSLQLHNDPL